MVNTIMDEEIGSGTPEQVQWAKVSDLLDKALALPHEARDAWLDRACGNDAALRAELDSLLDASEGSALLDRPALHHDLGHDPGFEVPHDISTDSTTRVPRSHSAAAFSSQVSDPRPGQTIGRYRVVEKLGEGGMGAVFKAIDTRLDRPVAIKLITRFDGTGLEKRRFSREAKAASALNHPNIVTIYEYNSERGTDYMAMEYIQGTTLDRLMREVAAGNPPGSRPPLETLLGYACQAAGALARAHEAGIVHRDLKPANIMVTADGVVKVLDFGLARQSAPGGNGDLTGLTIAGDILGTPAYMSPEQAMRNSLDCRSDIFSFGIILYEMACARHPFRGRDALETLNNIARQEPPEIGRVDPSVPGSVATLIGRCLRKDPAERPASMNAVRAELLAAMASVANTAPGAAKVGLLRRPLWAGAAALVLAISGGAFWFAQRTPELALTYTLEAQHSGGATFTAAADESFHAGDRVRLRIESPRRGFFYLIDEGPGANGNKRYWVLYPPVSGSAGIGAGHSLVTGWNVFDANPGTERLWVAFSETPVPGLQEALSGSDAGEVKDPAQALRVARLLESAVAPEKTNAGAGIRLRGAGPLLGGVVELRHR